MELVAIRGADSLLSEDPSLPAAVGFLVRPELQTIWEISLAAATAGGYWEAPTEQPSEAEMAALLEQFPHREHPSIETLRRARLLTESQILLE